MAFIVTIVGLGLSYPVKPHVEIANAAPTPQVFNYSSVVEINNGNGHGSGVHIGEGDIITAAHVVIGASSLSIVTADGWEQKAKLVWINKERDVALIHVKSTSNIASAGLYCDADAKVGTPIEVVGSPLALGIVHSWGRIGSTPRKLFDWKVGQIADVTIAPGNSGGPVFTEDFKEIVGIAVGLPAAPVGAFGVSLIAFSVIVPRSSICASFAEHEDPASGSRCGGS